MKRGTALWLVGAMAFVLAWTPSVSRAAGMLFFMRDLISDSAPALGVDHTITFQAPGGIPASGRLLVTPQAGAFTIPPGFDYGSIDVAVATSSPTAFVEQPLSVLADAATWGVTVATGTSGSVLFELPSGVPLAAGSYVRLKLGRHAAYGGAGTYQITNPTSTGSYRLDLKTRDGGNVLIDQGTALIAVVQPVSVSISRTDFDPPLRFNAYPTGTLPFGVTAVELFLQTDERATCRYSTTAGISYASMVSQLATVTGFTHTATVTGLSGNASYSFYVRCLDIFDNANPDDFPIAFTIGADPGPVNPPAPPSGGGAPFALPPNAPAMSLSGRAYPGSRVNVLQDGTIIATLTGDTRGNFSSKVNVSAQGVYSFSVIAADAQGRKSSAYASTIALVAGTQNALSGIFISPTLSLDRTRIEAGQAVEVAGQSAPGAEVEVWLQRQSSGAAKPSPATKTAATADGGGAWRARLDTDKLASDTYEVKARATLPELGVSDFSPAAYLGIGTNPSPDVCRRANQNADGKVSLVDFSVFLFRLRAGDLAGDINLDGRVSVADFSVLLFCWTG